VLISKGGSVGVGSLELMQKGNLTMLKQATVTLSDEEAKTITQFLNAPRKWEGDPENLVRVLNLVFQILKKLNEAFDDSPKEG
jgi:hypothetical protein